MSADTRLDRLFALLDSGSSTTARKAAAQQIGEVQKHHPYDLQNLLERTHFYLKSKNWATRIAAGQAIEAITAQVPLWNPSVEPKSEPNQEESASQPKEVVSDVGRFTFETFSIATVLKKASALLASGGQEFIGGLDSMDPKVLAKQRAQLKENLGFATTVAATTDELLDDSDLMDTESYSTKPNEAEEKKKEEMQELLATKGLSARQRNQAKRKLKAKDTEPAKPALPTKSSADPKLKTVVTDQPQTSDKIVIESVVDVDRAFEDVNEWPFERFCDELFNELFDAKWEVRHGAAVGLREILKRHAGSAGKRADTTPAEQQTHHRLWLGDCAIRLVSVILLDKFADFVDDEMVAPVRETSAQVLATLYGHMPLEDVLHVVDLLLAMSRMQEWETRHAAYLSLKYLAALRHDVLSGVVHKLLPALMVGLHDTADDVRMAASDSLLSVVRSGVGVTQEFLASLATSLWQILQDLDDITPATTSIMNLLAEIYTMDTVDTSALHIGASTTKSSLAVLIPRLWPFMRHVVRSVRLAVTRMITKLLSSGQPATLPLWLPGIYSDAVQLVYQNFILEENEEVLAQTRSVWDLLLAKAPIASIDRTIPLDQLTNWFRLQSTPNGCPIDRTLLRAQTGAGVVDNKDGSTKVRVEAAKALAKFATLKSKVHNDCIFNVLMQMLVSPGATERQSAALFLTEWARLINPEDTAALPASVSDTMLELLAGRNDANFYYTEVLHLIADLKNEIAALFESFNNSGVNFTAPTKPADMTSVQMNEVVTTWYHQLIVKVVPEIPVPGQPSTVEKLEARKNRIATALAYLETLQTDLHISVSDALAGAIVSLRRLPGKLNSIINPLMKAIKREADELLQRRAGDAVAVLLHQCTTRTPSPNALIIKSCASMLCEFLTDIIASMSALSVNSGSTSPSTLSQSLGSSSSAVGEAPSKKRKLETSAGAPPPEVSPAKRRKTTDQASNGASAASSDPTLASYDAQPNPEAALARRGAEYALQSAARLIGGSLFQSLPNLWQLITDGLSAPTSTAATEEEQITAAMLTLTLAPALHPDLKSTIVSLLEPLILRVARVDTPRLRYVACKALAVVAKHSLPDSMNIILCSLIPQLQDPKSVANRQGAALALHALVEELNLEVLPYVMFLIVPLLGRMSDQDEQVRRSVTFSFATLVKLMPLESSVPNPVGMSAELTAQRERERHFMEQLLGGKKVDNYEMPIRINTELRAYQQDGVNWLAFLNKYNLHGILADGTRQNFRPLPNVGLMQDRGWWADMGLGKTLQTICIIMSDDQYRRRRFEVSPSPENQPLPSLVVCPTTLIGHWANEIRTFCGGEVSVVQYAGSPADRRSKFPEVPKSHVVVISYDVLRNEIENFEKVPFNYCVLDEGHIIRNAKTKVTQSVKRIRAHHRLLLSGTPIQNNVLELWSLFDFLMPGFLGTERQFNTMYSKPIVASRDAKSSSQDQELGVLAMEALHRQVLPFILRRMKEDVLKDLPPKIIQDVFCDLSPMQVKLYEDFSTSSVKEEVVGEVSATGKTSGKHVFQALQYLRKLCSHPKLVLNESHPQYASVSRELKSNGSDITDIQHAPKLPLLKELLNQCGIGNTNEYSTSASSETTASVNQHRVLIFCQLKQMLDIIEYDLFKQHMPTVTYLRLDGSVPQQNRVPMVEKFNADPSIDVLLLTCKVGGLGLNLTGADTVIFMEHDWNPQSDLQAMDRAHRIGAKKTVNVYRLITRGTLEEKIMSLQKFKLKIANTVVSKENQSFASMNTSQLLDLFNYSGTSAPAKGKSGAAEAVDQFGNVAAEGGKQSGLKAVLDNLDELWDESAYAEEYNLDNFLVALKK